MPTTAKYATTSSDIGGGTASATSWTNPSYANGQGDGNSASTSIYRNDPKGENSNNLKSSAYGFAIPSTAIIQGIAVAITGSITPSGRGGFTASLVKASGAAGGPTGTTMNFGGSNSLGGVTLTPAEVNAAGFGLVFQANTTDPNQSIALTVDSALVTIYWDYPPLANGTIQKSYLYSVYRQGVYLGLLPNVTSDFAYSQDINSAGTAIQISSAVTADVSGVDVPTLDDESGNPIQSEDNTNLTIERYPDVVGNANSGALFRNGNQIYVTEFSNYHQNGIRVFTGDVQKWEANFGTSNGDEIKLTVYSDGGELNNYLVTGGDTLDQSQTVQNTAVNLFNDFGSGKGGGWNKEGQTFVIGAGVGNLEAVSILTNGGCTFYVSVYASVAAANTNGTVLATTTLVVPNYGTPTEVKFVFSPIYTVAAGTSLFFTVDTNASIATPVPIYKQNTDVYASGAAQNSSYSGGSGGGTYGADTGDLWFKTWYGGNSTTQVYSATDPTTMLTDTIARYNSKGGIIKTASGTTDLTGLSLGYTFKVATVFEALQKYLELAPFNWFWYVDIGSDILYFKATATAAKYQLIKGKHITGLNLAASTENVKNVLYFTGGIPSGSTNLFSSYTDATSIQNNKQRIGRQTDNRVTVQGTADAIGSSFVKAYKDETYQTAVTVLDTTMDISLFKVGDTVGFGGFGNFVDNLILQVVRVQFTPEQITMTLGQLPPEVNQTIKDIQQGLTNLETLANPSTPS